MGLYDLFDLKKREKDKYRVYKSGMNYQADRNYASRSLKKARRKAKAVLEYQNQFFRSEPIVLGGQGAFPGAPKKKKYKSYTDFL